MDELISVISVTAPSRDRFKPYVDPVTHKDLSFALRKHTNLLDRQDLYLQTIIRVFGEMGGEVSLKGIQKKRSSTALRLEAM